jgi:hypothetical protein
MTHRNTDERMIELHQERIDGFEHEFHLGGHRWEKRISQAVQFDANCEYRKIEKPDEPLSFWVARDEDGDLFCYNSEPSLDKDDFYFDGDRMKGVDADNELFPEIKAGQKVQFIQTAQVEA